MAPGKTHTIDFSWTMPELAAGRYFISLAISEGTLDEFTVCDYVENAAVTEAPLGRDVRGYLHLPCTAVNIHRH